jgi:hypothetical protein
MRAGAGVLWPLLEQGWGPLPGWDRVAGACETAEAGCGRALHPLGVRLVRAKAPRLPAGGWPWERRAQSCRPGFVVEGWGGWLAEIWDLLSEWMAGWREHCF